MLIQIKCATSIGYFGSAADVGEFLQKCMPKERWVSFFFFKWQKSASYSCLIYNSWAISQCLAETGNLAQIERGQACLNHIALLHVQKDINIDSAEESSHLLKTTVNVVKILEPLIMWFVWQILWYFVCQQQSWISMYLGRKGNCAEVERFLYTGCTEGKQLLISNWHISTRTRIFFK